MLSLVCVALLPVIPSLFLENFNLETTESSEPYYIGEGQQGYVHIHKGVSSPNVDFIVESIMDWDFGSFLYMYVYNTENGGITDKTNYFLENYSIKLECGDYQQIYKEKALLGYGQKAENYALSEKNLEHYGENIKSIQFIQINLYYDINDINEDDFNLYFINDVTGEEYLIYFK